ncbi:PP2C family protein-serine/threonine phosphatase [Jannaschia seohaensis]|uniref:Serine/threonine protein phosphatase PrpC n=1 Tax=Jannaschia seohaensis TaxID=475081 RepID=A0A2Y9ANA2_9RHOB|nr:protein phosphatase 2C domain-containing protein [Jannaschia seohaensis]PWJ19342.1 serine/threonine protein phosphatase PrpC [Jannaschia seohaensis]SSA46004.1 Serine/threonine protein phosphatase PrpC [Jannaschia seohaensis]
MSEPRADVATAVALGCRERQEDVVATRFDDDGEYGFAVLSDGMGGHDDGDLAARVIVSSLSGALPLAGLTRPLDQEQARRHLLDGVHAANNSLRARVEDGSGKEGMGGTVVAAILQNERLSWVSVGDSSLYLFRDGALSRLNEDHSLAPQIDLLVERGMMDPETARTHPQRGCLTSALVGARINCIDCPAEPVALAEGDILLMASDGLAALAQGQVRQILADHRDCPSEAIARALLDAVAGAGDPDQDNVSVIVVKPRPSFAAPRAAMPWPAARSAVITRIRAGIAQFRALFASAFMDRFVR